MASTVRHAFQPLPEEETMSKRWLVLPLMMAACLTAAAALAQDQPAKAGGQTIVATSVVAPSKVLPTDPYLGGTVVTKVHMARFCQDYGQCQSSVPPGEPCDT